MTRKTTIILLALLTCITIVNGQITRKSILLGGQIFYQDLNFNYPTSQDNQKVKTGVFNISIGTALKENAVYGFNLQYAPSSASNYYNGSGLFNSDTKQYSIGVFNRRYKNLAKDFYFFAEAGVAYNNLKQVYTDTGGVKVGTVKQWGGQLSLTPGISYKILNKLQLEILIPNIILVQYTRTTDKPEMINVLQKSFTLNTSLNSSALSALGVGFHFIL